MFSLITFVLGRIVMTVPIPQEQILNDPLSAPDHTSKPVEPQVAETLPVDHEASVTPIAASGELNTPEVILGLTGRPLPTFNAPNPLASHGPAYIIAMTNQKGGVGKTTTTINLGAALAEAGRKVLMVDMDPQGSLSIGLGVNPDDLVGKRTVYDMLMDSTAVPASDVVINTSVDGLDLLPANIQLSAAELRLAGEVAREYALDRAFESVRPLYDYILIDCQPSLGLLTVNALTAADGVVIPMECEFFALRGVEMLRETISKVQERLNNRLTIDGVLPTMVDARTLHTRETIQAVLDAFGDAVFHTTISRTVKFPETTKAGVSIIEQAPNSSGAQNYRNLAWELVARLETQGSVAK
jgi:chromosome partitioning protein